tara:strand:- start:3868 stop:4449 length:582 start_codon:yes stop_codon:yes gene_type:complete
MAIDKGIGVECSNLQSTGGIEQILLRSWTANDAVVYGNAASEHDIDSILTSSSAAAWFVFESKNETGALAVSATKENGSTAFECTISFMIPQINNDRFAEIQAMLDTCMMGMVKDTNGSWWVIGASEKYANEDVASKSQTFLNFTSAEGGTGAAYSDESGMTVTLTARQFELPRKYIGTVTVDTSALTATTAA